MLGLLDNYILYQLYVQLYIQDFYIQGTFQVTDSVRNRPKLKSSNNIPPL